jgi:tetratricopeptide (TPR) repeat protein
VEQYRNNPKPTPVVAEEMNVSYIIEGSGQKIGNRLLLTIQLVVGKDDYHIWSKQYDRNIQQIEDLIDIQREIAQLVALEIEAIITPEEKQLIDKIPTTNLTALDFYQRGKDEHLRYQLDNYNKEALERAEDLYNEALEYDSTFAQAYAGLADVSWYKDYQGNYFSEDFLDSVLILADIALSYDDQLAEAYTVKGRYYWIDGNIEQANEEYDRAIKFNPNDFQAYVGKGQVAATELDYVKRIYYYHKATSLNRGPGLPDLLRTLGFAYRAAGFPEKDKFYIQEALKLDGDSVAYYYGLSFTEHTSSNFEKAIESGLKGYAIDSLNLGILYRLGHSYLFHGQYEESLIYFEKYIERSKALGNTNSMPPSIGNAYWQNGYKKEAEYYFGEQKRYWEETIRLNRRNAQILLAYYNLAAVYAYKGEKEKAFENLRVFNQREVHNLWKVTDIKNNPIFNSIRDEPEFQQIVRDFQAKYQAEHRRVKKWLEENDML